MFMGNLCCVGGARWRPPYYATNTRIVGVLGEKPAKKSKKASQHAQFSNKLGKGVFPPRRKANKRRDSETTQPARVTLSPDSERPTISIR
jgi:hypothetical protein